MSEPRKDLMRPREINHGQEVKPEGGMAHSLEKKDDGWGGKKPPFPRSELTKKTRSGMALINDHPVKA